MANTTFNGPVRSENGFQDISINSTTGAVTVNATFGAATAISTLVTTGNATIGGNETVAGTLNVTGATTLGAAVIGGTQNLSGSGAVNLTSLTTKITTTGSAAALTLANGTDGQVKMLVMVTDGGGDATLTPTTKTGFTTITFNDAGDAVILQYFTTLGWMIISNYGTTVA